MVKPSIPVIKWGHPLAKGLLMDVPLFENGGILTANLAKRSTATLTSGPTWVRSPFGAALNFVHANTSYVKVASTKTLAGLPNWTLMVIYNSNSSSALAQDEDLYCERGSAGNDIFKLENRSAENMLWFRYRDDAATLNDLKSVTSPNDGKYHVFVVTKSGTTETMYFDGLQNAQTTLTATDNFTDATLDTRIGSDQADVGKYLDGTIPLVRGWNRCLTVDEVRRVTFEPWQIYARPSVVPYVNVISGVVAAAQAYWRNLMGVGQ